MAAVFGVTNVLAENETTVYYACVNNSSGSLTIVSAGEECSKNETMISWNQAGLKGDRGEQGIPGVKGDTGDAGTQGPKGDKGETGAVGPQGEQGIPGLKGDKGDLGPQGPPGPAGDGSSSLKSIAGHVNYFYRNPNELFVPSIVSGEGFTIRRNPYIGNNHSITISFPSGTFSSVAIPIVQAIGSYSDLSEGKDPLIGRYTLYVDGRMDLTIGFKTTMPPWEENELIAGITFIVMETGTSLPTSPINYSISN